MDNKTLTLDLDPTMTLLESLHLAIERESSVLASHQRLFFSFRQLIGTSGTIPISRLGVGPNSTLTLHVLPLPEGMQRPMQPKASLEFLNMKPPPNYVSGLGRGTTGFTTRSDIGPTHAAPDRFATMVGGVGLARVGYGRGKGPGKEEEEEEEEEENEKGYDKNQKFDEFKGNDVGLFFWTKYDDEVDAVWEEIDKRMDSRRMDRREARLKQEIEKCRVSSPNITEQFAHLKRKLFTMSSHEWDSILEIGDYSLRKKKSYVPVLDILLEKARQEKEHVAALDPKSMVA